jgi:hypothetical protein
MDRQPSLPGRLASPFRTTLSDLALRESSTTTTGGEAAFGALLDRAHRQATADRLVPADLTAPSTMTDAEKNACLRAQYKICLAAYRQSLKADTGARDAAIRNEQDLEMTEHALRRLVGSDAVKWIDEVCDEILATAAFDTCCKQQLARANETVFPGITRKAAWDLAAGAFAFNGCFGPGTFLSKLTGNAWWSFGLNPPTWVLAERMIPLIRMTTWRSEDADAVYPRMARAYLRKNKYALAGRIGASFREPKIHNPTAQDPYRTVSLDAYLTEKHGHRGHWQAWKNKAASDDCWYLFYSLCYALRNSVWHVAVVNQGLTSIYWSALNGVTHCVAGTMAGALTMLMMQKWRRRQCEAAMGAKFRGAEKLTETPEIQRLKSKKLKAELKLLGKKAADTTDTESMIYLTDQIALKGSQRASAKARRSWSSLIRVELLAGFESKWSPDFADRQYLGEVPGKLKDTFAGLGGKYLCLLFYTLMVTQVSWFTPAAHEDIFMTVLKYSLAAIILITPPAFSMRTEYTLLSLMLLDVLAVFYRRLQDAFRPTDKTPEEDPERVIVASHENRALMRSRSSYMSLGEVPKVQAVSEKDDDAASNRTEGESDYPPLQHNGQENGRILVPASDDDDEFEDATDGSDEDGGVKEQNGARLHHQNIDGVEHDTEEQSSDTERESEV